MLNSSEILKLVNDYLSQLPYERKPKSLYEPVEYVLSIGGKRIRPVLTLMPTCVVVTRPFTVVGMPIRPFSLATPCSCWPTSACSRCLPRSCLPC